MSSRAISSGIDVTGEYDLGNSANGIFVQGAGNILISGNRIINNRANGIDLFSVAACLVQGNLIGTDAGGVRPLGNASTGIAISGGTNQIGGLSPGAGNVIQRSTGPPGLRSLRGIKNEISGNQIYDNAGLGIDLGSSGVTTNDVGDVDSGANQLQKLPGLEQRAHSAFGATQVAGTLHGTAWPARAFRIEFFASPPFDPLGIPEGQIFLGSTNVTTDGGGNASFKANATLPNPTPTNFVVTAATATACERKHVRVFQRGARGQRSGRGDPGFFERGRKCERR